MISFFAYSHNILLFTQKQKKHKGYGLCDTFPVTFNNHSKTLTYIAVFLQTSVFFRNYSLFKSPE